MRQPLRSLDPEMVRAAMFYELEETVTDDDAAVLALAGEVILTNQRIVELAGAGSVPSLSRWQGKRPSATLVGDKATVRSDPWANGIIVERDDRLYDRVGLVERRIDDLTVAVGRHWSEAMLDVIRNGSSTAVAYPKAYDGKPLFSTTHKTGKSGTQSNSRTLNIGGTPTAPTAAEMKSAIWQAIIGLKGIKDDRGRAMNTGVNDFVIVYPLPFMEAVAGALGAATILEGGQSATNTIVASSGMRFTPVCDPESEWDDSFAIFAANGRVLFRVETEGSLAVESKGVGSDQAYDTGDHEHGASVDRGIGIERWQSGLLMQLT